MKKACFLTPRNSEFRTQVIRKKTLVTIAEGRSSPLRVRRRERLVLTGVSQRKFSGESAI